MVPGIWPNGRRVLESETTVHEVATESGLRGAMGVEIPARFCVKSPLRISFTTKHWTGMAGGA